MVSDTRLKRMLGTSLQAAQALHLELETADKTTDLLAGAAAMYPFPPPFPFLPSPLASLHPTCPPARLTAVRLPRLDGPLGMLRPMAAGSADDRDRLVCAPRTFLVHARSPTIPGPQHHHANRGREASHADGGLVHLQSERRARKSFSVDSLLGCGSLRGPVHHRSNPQQPQIADSAETREKPRLLDTEQRDSGM